VRWAVKSLRHKGIKQTAAIASNVLIDLSFDWRHGTDTMRWVQPDALGALTSNQAHSAPYQATKVRPFLQLLRALRLPLDCNFVDIGSGKGRVLLIAAEFGFDKVVGLEFSPALCEVARNNARIYAGTRRRLSPIEIVETDAAQYRFAPRDQVLFMYNPFDAFVMNEVLRNLRESLEAHPRPTWLIYNIPTHHDLISTSGLFATSSQQTIGGNQFRIYTG
jgi:SAM-dependent methyltransferase